LDTYRQIELDYPALIVKEEIFKLNQDARIGNNALASALHGQAFPALAIVESNPPELPIDRHEEMAIPALGSR
jgi:hypothetical protein